MTGRLVVEHSPHRSIGFTPATMRQVATDVTVASLEGIGHYAAMEAPDRLADALLACAADLTVEATGVALRS